jgi:hypothetical protein
MSKRHINSPELPVRVAVEAISGRKTIQEIAAVLALLATVEQFTGDVYPWNRSKVHVKPEVPWILLTTSESGHKPDVFAMATWPAAAASFLLEVIESARAVCM